MIFINLGNTSPQPSFTGMATKVTGEAITDREVKVPILFCLCDWECEYAEKVFYNVGGKDFENDESSFLFAKSSVTDTITFKLFKNGVSVGLLDATYGDYFPTGFSNQPLYVGIVLEWLKVFQNDGVGTYQVHINLNILGVASVVKSQIYQLMQFTEQDAHGTVRVDWIQNGNILSNDLDYTDLQWPQSIRFQGEFGRKAPVLEKDFYKTQSQRRTQIQDNIVTSYDLNTKLLPSNISNGLYYDMSLANQIFISDYNLFNNEDFKLKEVDTESFDEPGYFGMNTGARHTLIFTDRFQLDKKRNF